MVPFKKNLDKYNKEDLLNLLNKEMTYSQFPKKYFDLKEKYGDRIGHPIINLFDCINDKVYSSYILNLPKNGNF